jgi:hypothetical protein
VVLSRAVRADLCRWTPRPHRLLVWPSPHHTCAPVCQRRSRAHVPVKSARTVRSSAPSAHASASHPTHVCVHHTVHFVSVESTSGACTYARLFLGLPAPAHRPAGCSCAELPACCL